MDALFLSRLQFALTTAFHYIFPPLSIGLGVILVAMEAMYLRTKNPLYQSMTKFWVRIFGLIFAIGVASGIVLEFEFGTNWSRYSRYVGDVFGSALAAEGIFAFFLESGFLALLLFGWDRVSPRVHFFSTVMVCLGSLFSAIWIIVANSWMQTPAGFHIVQHAGLLRAEITDFWQVVFNPSTLQRLSHVISGALQAGAFMVLSVSAYYILKKRHENFARASLSIALCVALFGAVMQLVTGHWSALGVSKHQPAKLAAIEGHFAKQAPADLYLFGWVDEQQQRVRFGIRLPGMLSFLVHADRQKSLIGLNNFKPEDRPPVNIVFQGYHLMVAIGMALLGIGLVGAFFWWRGSLYNHKWFLWVLVFSVLGPQIANQAGWFTAEVGRQPWIVYGKMRTAQGLSPQITSSQVWASLIMFAMIYSLLFILFIYLLDYKIKHGPEEGVLEQEEGQRA